MEHICEFFSPLSAFNKILSTEESQSVYSRNTGFCNRLNLICSIYLTKKKKYLEHVPVARPPQFRSANTLDNHKHSYRLCIRVSLVCFVTLTAGNY